MTHKAYIHKDAGESSLRCTCGRWQGKNLVDEDGFAEHVLVTRPAFRAMTQVLAREIVTNRIVFTKVVDGHLDRAEDENAAAVALLRDLLAAAEPHLAAEHRDDAAGRLQEIGTQNGERSWPFVVTLREDADKLRAEHPVNDCWQRFDARRPDDRI